MVTMVSPVYGHHGKSSVWSPWLVQCVVTMVSQCMVTMVSPVFGHHGKSSVWSWSRYGQLPKMDDF